MDRILQLVPGTLRASLYSGSTAIDPTPDTGTIQVTRADGTTLVAAGTTTTDGGTGIFTYPITGPQAATLDILTARWTSTIGSAATVITHTEIVGGFLCTLAALKVVFPTKTDGELAAIRTATEQRLENACGRAFVPRLTVETRTVRPNFRLAWPDIRAIKFASVGGVALSANQIANLNVTASGILLGLPGPTSIGLSRVTVGYEHGYDYPDATIQEAMSLAAEETFEEDSDTALVIRREADNQSVTFASPSSSGSFRHPVLRRIVRDYSSPMVA